MIDQNFHKKVVAAHDRIQNDIRFTPLQYSPALSSQSNADVYLKLENFQVTGSFKARGATNKSRILFDQGHTNIVTCLLYTSPSPRDQRGSRMPSSA